MPDGTVTDTANQAATQAAAAQAAANAGNVQSTDAKFTQQDLDDIIGRVKGRIERNKPREIEDAVNKALAPILDHFAVADVDSLFKVGESSKAKDKDATEAQLRIARIENELKTYKGKYEEMLSTHRRASVRDAVFAAGSKAGCVDNDVLFDHLMSRSLVAIDESGDVYVRDDKGEPSHVSVEELVTATLKNKPHLQAAAPLNGAGSRPAAIASGPGGLDFAKMTKQERAAYLATIPELQQRFVR